MRRLIRLGVLLAAFVGGCQVQNWQAVDTCLDRGGQWLPATGVLPGGVCAGIEPG